MAASVLVATVEVVASRGSDVFAGDQGAFVNVAASVDGPDELRSLVGDALKELGIAFCAVRDIDSVANRFARKTPTEELKRLVAAASERPHELVLGTFFAYPSEGG